MQCARGHNPAAVRASSPASTCGSRDGVLKPGPGELQGLCPRVHGRRHVEFRLHLNEAGLGAWGTFAQTRSRAWVPALFACPGQGPWGLATH